MGLNIEHEIGLVFFLALSAVIALLWHQRRRFQLMEKALQECKNASDEKQQFSFNLLLNQYEKSFAGILMVDENRKVLSYNPKFVEMWNIASEVLETKDDEQILQSVMHKVVNPDDFIALVRHQYTHPEKEQFDEILLKNGTVFERHSAIIKSPDGKSQGRIWYFLDITEHKQVKEQLQQSEARFRALVQNSTDVIGITDAAGKILYRSPALTWITGFSPEEVAGCSVFDYYHPDDVAQERENFNLLLKSPEMTRHSEHRIRHKDGTWCHVELISSNYLNDPAIQGIVCNYRDISERKQAEEDLRQLSSRLWSLRDEESRRIARELHDSTAQKLAALNIDLSLLRKMAFSTEPEGVRMLSECVNLAQECTQEIRTMSYLLHPPLLDELGLADSIREYADGFAERSGIRVDLELPSELGEMPKEVELALFRILQESLANIRRHSGSQTASIRLIKTADKIQLEVKDTGHGMPQLAGAFSGIPAAGKIGVGISSMRERLRLLGGHLEIDSGAKGTIIRAVIYHCY